MLGYVPVMTALTAGLTALSPVPGLSADNVQSAIESLAARPSGGGGGGGDPIVVPAAPATVSFDVYDVVGRQFDPFIFRIGTAAPAFRNMNDGETYPQFFARLALDDLSDGAGHPLSIAIDGLTVTITCEVPFSIQGSIVPDQLQAFRRAGFVSAAPTSERVYSLEAAAVRLGAGSLADSPPRPLDPQSVVRGIKNLQDAPFLGMIGVSNDDTLFVEVFDGLVLRRASRQVGPGTFIGDVYAWINDDPSLNPSGSGSQIVADYDRGGLGGFVLWSRLGQPVALWSGSTEARNAILGSYP